MIRLLTGYQLKVDVLVGLEREAAHAAKVLEKPRGFAKLGAEGPVIEAVVVVVEVRTGREK